MFRPEVALHYYLTEICHLTLSEKPLALKMLRNEQIGKPFAALTDEPMFHAIKREEWQAFAQTHGLQGSNGALNFQHYGQTPLALDRWLLEKPECLRLELLALPWPKRLLAIDRFIGKEVLSNPLNAEQYQLIR